MLRKTPSQERGCIPFAGERMFLKNRVDKRPTFSDEKGADNTHSLQDNNVITGLKQQNKAENLLEEWNLFASRKTTFQTILRTMKMRNKYKYNTAQCKKFTI